MSCDNLPHNGTITRNTVVGLAGLMASDMADWIDKNVAFPNAMVDCITPASSQRELDFITETYGHLDNKPVFCEPFRQWVLEDNFSMGRPPLEDVGVELVEDVSDYEKMKIRILNGGHAIMAYPSALLGIEFVHHAIAHPLIRDFLRKVEKDEIFPLVPTIKDMTPQKYYESVEHRLCNPKLGDTTRRLCLDGSNRQPKFIIASMAECLDKEKTIEGLALSSALWCRYCYGVDEDGATIKPNDPNWHELQKCAQLAKHNPLAWLGMQQVYGAVGQSPVVQQAFSKWLNSLWHNGVEQTLRDYIK